jgi:hypothetical protein
MENVYKISHTAFPDGSVIKYPEGMNKPEILNFGNVIKKSLFNAATQNRSKSTKMIKMRPVKEVSSPMYAIK